MARAAKTFDAFIAIADPRRRASLDCLISCELDVMEIVGKLGCPQAVVSKHPNVLRRDAPVT